MKPSTSLAVTLTFSPNPVIHSGFIKPSAGIWKIIENCNLTALQGTSVEQHHHQMPY